MIAAKKTDARQTALSGIPPPRPKRIKATYRFREGSLFEKLVEAPRIQKLRTLKAAAAGAAALDAFALGACVHRGVARSTGA